VQKKRPDKESRKEKGALQRRQRNTTGKVQHSALTIAGTGPGTQGAMKNGIRRSRENKKKKCPYRVEKKGEKCREKSLILRFRKSGGGGDDLRRGEKGRAGRRKLSLQVLQRKNPIM